MALPPPVTPPTTLPPPPTAPPTTDRTPAVAPLTTDPPGTLSATASTPPSARPRPPVTTPPTASKVPETRSSDELATARSTRPLSHAMSLTLESNTAGSMTSSASVMGNSVRVPSGPFALTAMTASLITARTTRTRGSASDAAGVSSSAGLASSPGGAASSSSAANLARSRDRLVSLNLTSYVTKWTASFVTSTCTSAARNGVFIVVFFFLDAFVSVVLLSRGVRRASMASMARISSSASSGRTPRLLTLSARRFSLRDASPSRATVSRSATPHLSRSVRTNNVTPTSRNSHAFAKTTTIGATT
mmetsp:Transcript_19634/g.78118  ORF Transcript_19634/g.78118 Transcript_19634/m.78118 type:complete len:304 (+) Transcript_19634:644-1555(+)